MTAKDNVLFARIVNKTNDNKDVVYLEFSGDFDKTKISNIRFYEINLGFRYTKRNEEVNIYSIINQAKNEVNLSVKETLSTNYLTKAQTEATIKVMKDKIENVVTTNNFSTTLTQNARALRIAWNEISEYIQFEDGEMRFYDGKATEDKLKARINSGMYEFFDSGKAVGNMGCINLKNHPDKLGINFMLENYNTSKGKYMAWSNRDDPNDDFYSMKWVYASQSIEKCDKDTLNAFCNVDFHGYEIKNAVISEGESAEVPIVHKVTYKGNGVYGWTSGTLKFKNGILIYSTIL